MTRFYFPTRRGRIALASLAMLVLAQAAYADTWYLMAADVNVIGQPKAANMMIKGSAAGPIHFTSQGAYPGRNQCESERTRLLHSWRRLSLTTRGGWSRYGMHTPNAFAQCVANTDPRVSKSDVPTMDIMLQVRPSRIR
jgi:hypothetical protein